MGRTGKRSGSEEPSQHQVLEQPDERAESPRPSDKSEAELSAKPKMKRKSFTSMLGEFSFQVIAGLAIAGLSYVTGVWITSCNMKAERKEAEEEERISERQETQEARERLEERVTDLECIHFEEEYDAWARECEAAQGEFDGFFICLPKGKRPYSFQPRLDNASDECRERVEQGL